jgi:prepilin-type N-terminal cleavage/methylation domain-containing protein
MISPSCSRQGLTLIELLVAIAIALLLVAVVYMVYGAALNTIRAQNAWRESLEPAADALDLFQRDVVCALILRGSTNASFVLSPATEEKTTASTLHFYTAEPGAGSNDWQAYGIREVKYSLRPDDIKGRLALIRQSRQFRIPSVGAPAGNASPCDAGGLLLPGRSTPAEPGAMDAAETNPPPEILLRSLAAMQILVYDGMAWTNAWGAGPKAGALPQAARVTLRLELPSGPRTVALETLIPSGHKINAPSNTTGKVRK